MTVVGVGAKSNTMDDVYFAALFEARILDELRPAMTSRDFLRWGTKGASNAFSFTIQDDPGPSAALTEGTEYLGSDAPPFTSITTSKATATASEVGIMAIVTDVLTEISLIAILPQVSGLLTRSTQEKWETDVAAKMDDFGTATTAASTLTPDDFLRAVSAIEQRDAATGPLVAYLHPKQTGELRAEVAATTAIVTAGQATGGVPTTPVTGALNGQGDWGSLFGVRVFQTSLVASSGGLRQGSISVSGQCNGAYELWSPRIELERKPTLRGSYVVSSACYGLVNVDITNRGQMLKSAA